MNASDPRNESLTDQVATLVQTGYGNKETAYYTAEKIVVLILQVLSNNAP